MLLFGLLLIVSGPNPLGAQTRFHRLFDAEDGLNPPAVRSLAQDQFGFLWIGTEGGLFRYDGVEMRRWAPDALDRTVAGLAASPLGPVVARREGGALFAVTARGAEPLTGPGNLALDEVRSVSFDAEGGLWIIREDDVWFQGPEDDWKDAKMPLDPGERLLRVRPHLADQVHILTTHGVWRIGQSQAPDRVLDQRLDIVDVLTTHDHRVFIVTFLGRVLELTSNGATEILRSDEIGAAGRAISIVERGTTLWLAIDRYLVGWSSSHYPVVLDEDDNLESGGPLLVDHEGSLWMGSFEGLYQFPEPDTQIWTQRTGLPSNHVRYVARTGDKVWFTTWQGGGYLHPGPRGWHPGTVSGWTPTQLCVDSQGVLMAGSGQGLVQATEEGIGRPLIAQPISLYDCHESPDGALWLATDRGLLMVGPDRRRARPIATPIPDSSPIEAVLVDRDGRLWISGGEQVCRAQESRLRSDGFPSWACDSILGAVHVSGGGLIQTSSGAVWASSNRVGVVQHEEDGWVPLPGLAGLPSRSVLSLVPSPTGGVWLVGHGVLHRVLEAPLDSAKWRVEERLSYWHGLPGVSGTTLLEDTDGALWVTTSQGLAHVPPQSRFTRPEAPRVVLVDARIGDESVELESGREFPHSRNHLELGFAALSFRDPLLVRYQVRLSPDDPWLDTAGQPRFRWVDLSPGDYRAEVRASLDGVTWSATPAHFSFRVAPPWYREPWAMLLFLSLAVLVLYGIHRIRVGHLLELERQRTRIAMDLHDEIGSGLGSIGILSGILAHDGLDAREERSMIREIATTTGELGAALSQIVWALDPKARTMEEVASRLAEIGRRLFAGDTAEFITRFPKGWPGPRPSEIVRRNVVLIGLEALHNAARHSQASSVELRISAPQDGRWTLEVVDNGIGLPDAMESPAGFGRRSMRRRAAEIGAELTWSIPRGGGTVVRLRFSARGRSQRIAHRTWHVRGRRVGP